MSARNHFTTAWKDPDLTDTQMIYILNNFLPISVATLATFLLAKLYDGFFNPVGDQAAESDPRRTEVESFAFRLGLFAGLFWMSAILTGAILVVPAYGDAGPWMTAIGLAVIIWIGFIFPALFITYRFNRFPRALFIRDALFWLCVIVTMAVIIRAIGVTRPL